MAAKKQSSFFVILSENHETTFAAPYRLARFTSESEARRVACLMASKYGKVFHIMKSIGGAKPLARAVEF